MFRLILRNVQAGQCLDLRLRKTRLSRPSTSLLAGAGEGGAEVLIRWPERQREGSSWSADWRILNSTPQKTAQQMAATEPPPAEGAGAPIGNNNAGKSI